MTIAVKQLIDEAKLKEDITYSLANLTDAMMRQPGLFAWYSTVAAQAARQVDDLKLLLEAKESMVYRDVRDKAAVAGVKITDAGTNAVIATNDEIIKIKKALNEAKQIEAVAKGAIEAFRHRRDMLIQIGADSREERKGEIRTMGLDALKDRTMARIQGRSEE